MPLYLYCNMEKENRLLICAAGGLVENEKGEFLFIFRRNKWDLPKGKLDPGETLEECAKREVSEETGVNQLRILKFLIITYHDYEERGIAFLKESYWYHMKAEGNQTGVPQSEEDITELKWIAPTHFNIVQENTYPGILEVLHAAGFSISVDS